MLKRLFCRSSYLSLLFGAFMAGANFWDYSNQILGRAEAQENPAATAPVSSTAFSKIALDVDDEAQKKHIHLVVDFAGHFNYHCNTKELVVIVERTASLRDMNVIKKAFEKAEIPDLPKVDYDPKKAEAKPMIRLRAWIKGEAYDYSAVVDSYEDFRIRPLVDALKVLGRRDKNVRADRLGEDTGVKSAEKTEAPKAGSKDVPALTTPADIEREERRMIMKAMEKMRQELDKRAADLDKREKELKDSEAQ